MTPRILCAFLLTAAPAAAADLPALYDAQGAVGGPALDLRAEPDAAAEILGSLPADARGIEVVALSEDGAWGLVGQGEGGGWLAMEGLSRQPDQSPWWQLRAPLRCLGTEPFWSLSISAAAGSGTFNTPEPPALDLQTQSVWPGSDWMRTAGVTLSGGDATATLVLTGGACSDGMSDRTYGIAATLLLSGGPIGGDTPLTGCCTLSEG
jgi:uncharacterized membrane protein